MPASPILKRKLQKYREQLFTQFGRTNRMPKAIIGAEYYSKKEVDKSGPHPQPLAPKLEKELRKIGEPGTKGIDNYIGCCCEVRSSNRIMITDHRINVEDIIFTEAMRPATGSRMRPCQNCQKVFG
jgi:hypothetical protein